MICAQLLSSVQFFVTPRTVALQASLSMGFSGKNTGVGCHFLLQGNLPEPGIAPTSLTSPALIGGFFTAYATWEYISWSVAILCSRGITEDTQRCVWGG